MVELGKLLNNDLNRLKKKIGYFSEKWKAEIVDKLWNGEKYQNVSSSLP